MRTGARPPVTILTSGIGLGVYIPALLIKRQLAREGVTAELEVLESYYTTDNLRRYVVHRERCRRNFAAAQMAHRMARGVESNLDQERVHALLKAWARQERTDFIVWSGFWLPILEEYRRRTPHLRISRDHCRIDADISASFKVHRALERDSEEIWLWKGADNVIVHEIPVTSEPPLPFAEREHRVVAHGGGWGLGDYADTLEALAHAGYALDVVVHDPAERRRFGPRDRWYFVDPDWEPWWKSESGEYIFPPMAELIDDGSVVTAAPDEDFHVFHSVIRRARAIVSKPGGCTLIDSLAAATPLVMLEAYGYAEEANARIWKTLKFGVPYGEWREAGFDVSTLERTHAALRAYPRDPSGYPREYANRLHMREAAR